MIIINVFFFIFMCVACVCVCVFRVCVLSVAVYVFYEEAHKFDNGHGRHRYYKEKGDL